MSLLYSLAYLLAAVLFILGLKQLSSPKTARNGNYTAAVGMVIALGATVPQLHFTTAGAIVILVGVIVGAAIGTIGARQVKMRKRPAFQSRSQAWRPRLPAPVCRSRCR